MGLTKHLLRQMGFRDYRDAEVQSAIHAYAHDYEGAENPSSGEYKAMLQGLRQQIVDDPSISEADKFRSGEGRGAQTGLVTRLDQELKRVETGHDEKGRPLRPEQLNQGKNFAAMQRLSVMMHRNQTSKDAYLDTYARTMGISGDEARGRWNELVDRPMDQRENTRISLRDNWRDQLSVTGVTAQQQADLGQGNAAREAMRLMESERQAQLATLPSRPAISDENRTPCLSPEEVNDQQQCKPDGCGQFGHEPANCPHQAEVDELRRAEKAYLFAQDQAILDIHARTAKSMRDGIEDGTVEPYPITDDDPNRYYVTPGLGSRDEMRAFTDRDQALKHLGQVTELGDSEWAAASATKAKQAAEAMNQAQSALEQARGPIPPVSSRIESVGYNTDTGLVEITNRPYTRKRTGEVAPAKTYLYRMSADEYQEMMSAESLTSYVSTHLWARASRGGNDDYRWENENEEREARRQVQCPTCGQWAAMTSAHQCPVAGTRQFDEDACRRERAAAAREWARVRRLPADPVETAPRALIKGQSMTSLTGGGTLRFPERRQALAASDRAVAIGPFEGQYLGARVSGRCYTWTEPGTQQRLMSTDTVRCTCGGPPCRHTDKATNLMSTVYSAQVTNSARPGGRRFDLSDEQDISEDAPHSGFTRQSYATIRADRRGAAEHRNRAFATRDRMRAPTLAPPVDTGTGESTDYPTQWSSGGRQINLSSAAMVRGALEANLRREGEPLRWNVRHQPDGSMQIHSRTSPHGQRMTSHEQAELASKLGLPVERTGPTGVYVPADESWRAEFLDRAAGQPPRIQGARFVAPGTEVAGPHA